MRDFVILINVDDAVSRTMARRLRAEHIYCQVLPADTPADVMLNPEVRGILVAAASTGLPSELPHLRDYLQCGLPMLCMGDAALTLCEVLGGELSDRPLPGGVEQVRFDHGNVVFDGVEDGERYLHACRYMTVPQEKASTAAQTEDGVIGFRVHQRSVWGLAFQLERNDPGGTLLLLNFCRDVCGCTLWWSNQAFIERAKEAIEQAADGGDALCALSGGVDSGVCALLGHMALGSRLHCIFVDTGLMRKGEAMQVMDFYNVQAGLDLRRIDASEEFLAALQGVKDAKEKERIIFFLLRDILRREAASIPNIRLMIQGTNYSDAMQDSAFPLELPSEDVRIIEPVRELFKDEVRYIGEELGMSPAMLLRQPFPGSGLASRIMSDVTPEKLAILREADAIFRYEITQNNHNRRLWQYFAALSEASDTDAGYVVTLRAVQAAEGAGGMAARLPNDLLERVTLEILSRCPQVNRVLFDLTPSKNYTPMER
ncbi:MAG: hypothetical protein E7327_02785 [Clostridiales bacterium]|nr:hypothetical protein [Clostridiales bacterium]